MPSAAIEDVPEFYAGDGSTFSETVVTDASANAVNMEQELQKMRVRNLAMRRSLTAYLLCYII